MNLDAPELNLSDEDLRKVLQEGVDLNYIKGAFGLPRSDSFTLSASNLLPENLYTTDGDGVSTPLPEATLKQRIDENAAKLFNLIKTNAEDALVKAISVEGQLGVAREKEALEKIVKEITTKMDTIIEKSQNFVISSKTNFRNSILISNYKKAMSEIINANIKKLSNKNKRDLGNDKEYFNNVVAKIIAEILVKIKEIVRKDLLTSITPSQTISTTVNTSLINAKDNSYELECYIRVYYQKGQGADPETFDGLTVLNTKLISGRICAVDNSSIFLNSKILMPDGREFLAKDTFVGSYVRPAVYLYFTTREEAENYLTSLGVNATTKLKVRIIPPTKPKSVQELKKPSNITIRGVNKKLV